MQLHVFCREPVYTGSGFLCLHRFFKLEISYFNVTFNLTSLYFNICQSVKCSGIAQYQIQYNFSNGSTGLWVPSPAWALWQISLMSLLSHFSKNIWKSLRGDISSCAVSSLDQVLQGHDLHGETGKGRKSIVLMQVIKNQCPCLSTLTTRRF